MRILARFVALGALLVTTCAVAVPAAGASASASAESGDGKLVLVLDASGSMKEKDASGQTKIAAAKKALGTVVDGLAPDAQVGLRVYGAKVFSGKDAGACTDSQLVVPIGSSNKPALKQAIAQYRPYGETPIGHALREAGKDLGTTGQRSIVLVSDGEPTCQPDPCLVAAELAAQGIDLRIDVVGLNVDGKARDALRCIADKGNGTYYDATDADDLTAGLTRMSTRAFRPFSVAGKPIKGTTDTAKAPEMAPGQYTDTIGGTKAVTGTKYYRLPYVKGSTMHVAVTARPAAPAGEDIATDGIMLRLKSTSGQECAFASGTRVDSGSAQGLINVTIATDPTTAPYDECKGQQEYLLEVLRKADSVVQTGDTGTAPMELVYSQEAAVTNAASLPAAVDASANPVADRSIPVTATSAEIVGGSSFNDAAELKPGTVKDSLQAGELLFYKVKVGWGQTPAVTFRVEPNPAAAQVIDPSVGIYSKAYAPDRAEVPGILTAGTTEGVYTGSDAAVYDVVLPPVRYNNRSGSYEKPVSLDGYYYFAIRASKGDDGVWQAPLTISTEVSGAVTGTPAYAPLPTPTPSAAPTRTAGADAEDGPKSPVAVSDGGTAMLPLVLAIAAAVIVVAAFAAGLLISRRRRRPGA